MTESRRQGESPGLAGQKLPATSESCDLEQVALPPETPVSTAAKMGVTLPAFREEQIEVMLEKHSEK